ncbi:hypothetical protein SESBI_36693 [Sesbania bispinosa]|nr:hypothetical protein SESBI_36693 [Sesbania bispinosa]
MPTLHKFKLLATQCAVAGSPTRSPTTSPVIHLRRRKTLRMFLARPQDRRRFHPPPLDPPETADDEVKVRHKLKDLFVSSPPPPPTPPLQNDDKNSCHQQQQNHQDELLPCSAIGVRFRTGSPFRRAAAAASLRPVSSAFRYRLLRRAWRPVLFTIPE